MRGYQPEVITCGLRSVIEDGSVVDEGPELMATGPGAGVGFETGSEGGTGSGAGC